MKFLYFLYLIRKTDFKFLFGLIDHTKSIKNTSRLNVIKKMFICFYKYNIAFTNYFVYEFENKEHEEIKTYANSLFMYRFQKKMNDAKKVKFFRKKKLFYKKFQNYVCHEHIVLSRDIEPFINWLDNTNPKYLFCKTNDGQSGDKIIKVDVSTSQTGNYLFDGIELKPFYRKLLKNNLTLVEKKIDQHPILNNIHPSSLNTIRIITQVLNPTKVDIIGATLRAGVNNSFIDNCGKGGVDCAIDIKTGSLIGPISMFDPRKKAILGSNHPTTGTTMVGLTLPFWEEVIVLAKKAALVVPTVKSVGWDVFITENGAFLLEGNHNWSSLIQKALGRGLKNTLSSYNFS